MPNSYPKTITLGSGKLYIQEFDGSTIPEIDTMCVEANILGLVSGGATLTYTPSFYEATDDLGYAKKNVMTAEEVTLTTGVCTFNGDTLSKLTSTARVTEATGKRTVKIGGTANDDGKSYALCFHHEDARDGDKWVQIVGRNQAGFSLAFTKDKETVIDTEFKAEPMDGEGTLVVYTEEDASVTGPTE